MATIADKSRTKEIIERLQGLVETASPVPFAAGKISLYKDEIKTLLDELESQMDIELKTYHEVNDRRGKLINEAKKEAEKIIFQAEQSASRMRVSKRSTNVAPLDYGMLDEEELKSLGSANEIYAASLIYTDEMLSEVSDLITNAYNSIRGDYEIMLQVLDEKLQIINNNKTELMNGLQEMEVEDRNQQILEIGQLLSNELYNERMKHKMSGEQYDDGSVQLSFDFQRVQEELTRKAEEKAAQAEQEMLAMQMERDKLLAEIEEMKQAERQRRIKTGAVKTESFVKNKEAAVSEEMEEAAAGKEPADEAATKPVEKPADIPKFSPMPQAVKEEKIPEKVEEVEDEDVEYEVVYVTEDELEEGEEYEVEYVDEEEIEDIEEIEETEEPEETEEAEEVMEDEDDLDAPLPLVPLFKEPEKVASIPADKLSSLISSETKIFDADAKTAEIPTAEVKKKLNENKKGYVEAKMDFDESFDITEF